MGMNGTSSVIIKEKVCCPGKTLAKFHNDDEFARKSGEYKEFVKATLPA